MSSNREHKVDRLFREGLGEGSVPPPPDVWRNVAAELAGEPRRRRGGWIFFFAGMAAAGLFAAIAFRFFLQESNSIQDGNVGNVFADIHGQTVIPADSCDPSPANSPEKVDPIRNEQVLLVHWASQVSRSNPSNTVDENHVEANVLPGLTDQAIIPDNNEVNPKPNQLKPGNLRDFLNLPLQPGQNSPKTLANSDLRKNEPSLDPDLFTPLKKDKSFGWSIAGNFAPDFNGQASRSVELANEPFSLSGSPQNSSFDQDESAPNNEKVVTAYSAGLRLSKSVAPKVQVQTGINYASRSGRLPLVSEENENLTGVSNYSAQLLELPVLARYNWVDGKRVKLFVSSGASLQWVLKSEDIVETGGVLTMAQTPESSIKPEQLNWVVGTGVELLPVPRVGIQLEPMLRYGLLKSNLPGQPGRSIGTSLNTGLNFHF